MVGTVHDNGDCKGKLELLLQLAWVRSEVDSKDNGLEAKWSSLCLY
jgi:hypothetical protein